MASVNLYPRHMYGLRVLKSIDLVDWFWWNSIDREANSKSQTIFQNHTTISSPENRLQVVQNFHFNFNLKLRGRVSRFSPWGYQPKSINFLRIVKNRYMIVQRQVSWRTFYRTLKSPSIWHGAIFQTYLVTSNTRGGVDVLQE